MLNKSASAPELHTRTAETQTNHISRHQPPIVEEISSYETSMYSQFMTQPQDTTTPPPEPRRTRERERERQPSRINFLANVYVLLGIQVFLSTLQWLGATYRWRPLLNGSERSFYVLLLLLTWLNLTLAFVGFRRLQNTYPLNWIVFACMFESLTLLVMCLCIRELDLSWYLIGFSMAVLFIYTPLGLWMPSQLTPNLWILVFLSLTVVVTSFLALITSLAMHWYVPLTVALIFFGPWTMYNTQRLHAISREHFSKFSYLQLAAKMYIAYGCTVGGLAVASRITIQAIESEECKDVVFCPRRFNSDT